jgi:sugar transferase (PEP-CTERM/EpsH1 system associated)
VNILYVVPYVPNLIRVRPYNLIERLARRGHQVTVLTLISNEKERADGQNLSQICHRVETFIQPRSRSLANSIFTLPTRTPLQAVYSWHSGLASRLVELADGIHIQEKFDVIHIEHIRGAKYGLHYLANRGNTTHRLPVIWDSVDCISLLFRMASQKSRSFFGRWISRFELGRTKRYERELAGLFDGVTVTSPKDRDALLALLGKDKAQASIHLLPNGVNLDYFRVEDTIPRSQNELVVSGKMSYHANITMVLNLVKTIMPLIWENRPDVRLTIVGKDPSREILALRQQPRIEVTGAVPDIRPFLQRAAVAVVPITYGVGIQNKVLEAMACGTPVVASPQAVSALQVVPWQDILVARDPQAFARSVLELLDNDQKRCLIGSAGRRYVERHHDWDVIAGQLEGIYASTQLRTVRNQNLLSQ